MYIYVSCKKLDLLVSAPTVVRVVSACSNLQEDQSFLQYRWSKGKKEHSGLEQYKMLHQLINATGGGIKLTVVAVGGIRRAAGPYCCNDPGYMDT